MPTNDTPNKPLILAQLYGPNGARWVLARVQVPFGTNLVVFKGRHYYRRVAYEFCECEPVFVVVEDEQGIPKDIPS